MATPLPTQVNYPQTTLDFVDVTGAIHTYVQSASVTTPLAIPAAIRDGAAEVGAAGQLLSAGAGGALLWVDPAAAPNLAAVLAVATAGDADGQTISNLASVALSADGSNACTLAGVAGQNYMDVSTPVDSTGVAKAFSGCYARMSFGSQLYYLPLFVPA